MNVFNNISLKAEKGTTLVRMDLDRNPKLMQFSFTIGESITELITKGMNQFVISLSKNELIIKGNKGYRKRGFLNLMKLEGYNPDDYLKDYLWKWN